jgi:isopentenyldiphosphate isomerase/UDP:flavonoid glycosyltransferase YjiC (YdhE family)
MSSILLDKYVFSYNEKIMNPKVSIACFVSSHGFGHAARSSAVMAALQDRCPVFHFEIFTQTPEWFFAQSLKASFVCHPVTTDIGLVQTSALQFDLHETLEALNCFLPFDDEGMDRLAERVKALNCQLIVCDISPLGIAVGKRAHIPTVLLENFTWDWIYREYVSMDRRFDVVADYLKEFFDAPDYRVQTDPVCDPKKSSFRTPPIARMPVSTRQETRQRLGIFDDEKMVLITMGGVYEPLQCVRQLSDYHEGVRFVIPGAAPHWIPLGKNFKNIVFLPRASGFYHPDLVRAADAVIGKAGYSTLAEVFYAGVPFGYVSRTDFRESPVIESYIQKNIKSIQIPGEAFHDGGWLKRLPELLSFDVRVKNTCDGAKIAAAYIAQILRNECELIEIVDKDHAVIGAAPRREVHGKNHWVHRVVHALVFDRRNRLLLQKRSMAKTVAPGKWDTSVGGHVDFAEDIEDALYREMEEELGIRPETLQFIYEYTHQNDFESEWVRTYLCRHDGDVTYNKAEIDAVKYWEMSEINAWLGKGIFSDNFEDEFKRYCFWAANHKKGP